MTGLHLEWSTGLHWPGAHFIEQIPSPSLFLLNPSILKCSHQKMGRQSSAGLKERKHICATISNMHNRGLGAKAAQARDSTHPDIALSWSIADGGGSRVSAAGAILRDIRLLHRTAQHFTALGHHGQHRLQGQPSSSLIADLAQAFHYGVMGEVHFGGVLDQQHERSRLNLFACLVPLRLHQRENSSPRLRSAQAVQGYAIFPGLHVGGLGRRGILGQTDGRFHSASRSPHIRCRLVAASDMRAQRSASRMSCMFIFLF